MKKVYADASLILALMMGPSDPFHGAAARFLMEAAQAGVRIVVSELALMEAVDVLRKRAKMHHRCRNGSGRERDAAGAAASADVARLAAFVNAGRDLRLMEILESASSVTVNFRHLLAKMLEYEGLTPRARKGDSYRHEGIGPIDLIHILLAHLAEVPAICTTDKALAQIKDDPLYGGMEIITLLPRPAAGKGQ